MLAILERIIALYGQSRPPLLKTKESSLRTKPSFARAVGADAAFLRACGIFVAALQLMSPDRSFEGLISNCLFAVTKIDSQSAADAAAGFCVVDCRFRSLRTLAKNAIGGKQALAARA